MSEAIYKIGDVFDVMSTMPANSVDLVLTSPPFLALRSYLPADHPGKHKEIGSEPTPAEFIDTMLALTAEWGRLLAPHGSLCVELGDTYSGSGGAGGDYADGGIREGQQAFSGSARKRVEAGITDGGRPARSGRGTGWPLAKSMVGIPHLYHLSLAYGRNILTGEPSPAGQWLVRNVVAWCRPNPPVGALGDKFRPATSYMTIATKSPKRWFDLDAVRTPFTGNPGVGNGNRKGQDGAQDHDNRPDDMPTRINTHDGAPPLDWWQVSTQAYRGSHYATWPEKLLDRPILAMCPRHVCTVCGEPRRRIVDVHHEANRSTNGPQSSERKHLDIGVNHGGPGTHGNRTRQADTIGWTDCEHGNQWRRGIVLDPFGGTGTTGSVSSAHGRDSILIDIDERNADLARERVGMFLTVEDHRSERCSAK